MSDAGAHPGSLRGAGREGVAGSGGRTAPDAPARSQSPDPALEVSALRVPFGDAPGLVDIGFAVPPGERLVIVGASGAGKTTLLRAIAGLAPADGGRVRIGGRDVTALAPERRDAVYLHQTPLLFPHLSVFENIAFPLRVRRLDDAEIRRRVGHILDRVRLADFAERRPRTLSGGQRHRIALARSIVARPKALLLDEPLTSLDPSLRQEMREVIITLQDEYGHALVAVTHDLDAAGALADRIGVLLDGHLARVAPPAALFARPGSLAVARFLGVPNELPATRRPDGALETALGTLPPADGAGPASATAMAGTAGATAADPAGATGPAPAAGVDPARPDPQRADTPSDPAPAASLMVAFWPAALRRCADGATAVVLSVEHGPERAHARIRVGGHALVMAVDPVAPPAPGDRVRVALEPGRVMRFPAS